MGSVPRIGFRRGLTDLYDYLDNEIPLGSLRSGKVFYVCNLSGEGGSDSVGAGSFDRPFATIDYAIGQCKANRGDTIIVRSGHAENISAASTITCDIAGVRIIGLGNRRERPTLTWTATAGTIAITADNVTWQNFQFVAGIDAVVTGLLVAAKGCTIKGNTFRDGASTFNFINPINVTATTSNTVDSLSILGNEWNSPDSGCKQFLLCACTMDSLRVNDNEVVVSGGTDSALVKFATGKIFTNAKIIGNFVQHAMTANELLVNNDGSTNTGIIAHNRVGHADTTTTHDLGIDGLGCRVFDNLSTSTDSVSGFVLPAIDVNN